MATVLKKQESLDAIASKKFYQGVMLIIIGAIVFFFIPFIGIIGIGLALVGIIVIKSGGSFSKGAEGEALVSDVLEEFPDDWYIFNDMIVGNSQVDHIVICPKGVYTIETKNYRGTIYGNANEKEWFQVLENNHKVSFYNPVKQGNKHSLELSKYLGNFGFKTWINTIVIFPNPKVQLKVYSPKVNVIHLDELYSHMDVQRNVLNPDICSEIVDCLLELVPQNLGDDVIELND